MTFAVRNAWPEDLERLASVAVDAQADPDRHCAYLGDDAESIRADIVDIDGADVWTAVTWVAVGDRRSVLGWVAAESDAEMGRVWWWGPFLAVADHPLNEPVFDALLDAAERALERCREFEFAVDGRGSLLRSLAEGRGAVAEEGSVALRADRVAVEESHPAGVEVRVAVPTDDDLVVLHDRLFAGTHTSGALLLASLDERHDRLVALCDGEFAGYVATEVQNDGSLYIDYLGVADRHRRRGIGRALISIAMSRRAGSVTHAHLTVRESNGAARALYVSLGFVEDRIIVPLRLGFSVA